MNIHIMPIKQFLLLNVSNTSAAIISTSTGIDRDRIPCPYVLAEYMDLDYDDSPRSFSAEQAAAFAHFVKVIDKCITDLYICCDAGESRSPAIAAAICRWFGQNDYHIWDNPQYHPNMLCFCLMAEALGLHTTDMELEQLIQISHSAFKKAIQKARTGDIL